MSALEVRNSVVVLHGAEYSAQPATIKSTMLGIEDHGIMSFWLHTEWPGAGIGVGGYALDTYDKTAGRRVGHASCGALIAEVLKVVGVHSWEALKGARIHVLFEGSGGCGSTAAGIADADLTRVVVLREFFEELKA